MASQKTCFKAATEVTDIFLAVSKAVALLQVLQQVNETHSKKTLESPNIPAFISDKFLHLQKKLKKNFQPSKKKKK